MKTLNPDHVKALIGLVNAGPFLRHLGMELSKIGIGFAKVELEIEASHLNLYGGIHGGVYASLIDTAAYWAVYGDVEEGAGLITLDLGVDNLAPIREGRLLVEGKRVKAGRTICVADAVIRDGQGKCLARGHSKLMVLPGLQTISQAISAVGHRPLPPKFIAP